MGYGRSYSGDPYWTTAKFDGKDATGAPVKRGTRIFYYPKTRSVYQGAAAEDESRRFDAAKFDEAQYSGNW